ncbi:hypothetical protein YASMINEVIRUS_1236 [Yasminevirus sp. GU-2018]|uniref:Uncharacterized protein n=1 Tax=Yasminevirus sp. GU-2018 TaxID=2420051 RepID=A0A5K0UB27_9VIRU|nr:hypothetical protein YASMINEVIRUS_1236 [Yasminevirus sp. GU-2018]
MSGSTKSPNLTRDTFFGVDVGSHKLVVGKCFSNKRVGVRTTSSPVTEIVGDTTDNRIIPNRMLLPLDTTTPRAFGNNVNGSKALNLDNLSSSKIERTSLFRIGEKLFSFPGCVAKNMIMSYVKTVMRMRVAEDGSEPIKTVAYVPKYGHMDDLKQMHADALGIECIVRADVSQYIPKSESDSKTDGSASADVVDDFKMTDAGQSFSNVKLVPISDVHALVMAYVNRHVVDAEPATVSKDVVLIDIGHTKQQIIRFKVLKTSDSEIEVEQIGYASKPNVAGDAITKAFCSHIRNRLAKERVGFTVKESSLIEQVTKLKHQLSINSVLTPWFQGDSNDVTLTITRAELEEVVRSVGADTNLVELMEYVILPSKTKHGIRSDKRQKTLNIEIVGGCSRMPIFAKTVDTFCTSNGVAAAVSRTLHPDEAVAEGATFFGWLLDNDSISVKYTRYIRSGVYAHFERVDSETNMTDRTRPFSLFREGERIVSVYGSKKNGSNTHSVHAEAKNIVGGHLSDTSCIELSVGYGQNVCFYVGKTKMILEPKRAECEFMVGDTMYVEFTYNMIENVEVSKVWIANSITQCEVPVPFRVLYCTDDSIGSIVDVAKLRQTYTMYEAELLNLDADAMRRQYLMNYMEEFFYKKDFVNSLLRTVQSLKGVSRDEYVDNVDVKVTWGLTTHVKELYDFYQFCRAYMYDEDNVLSGDTYLKNKHDYIVGLLNNRYAVIKLTQATCIVSDIIDSYSHAGESMTQ